VNFAVLLHLRMPEFTYQKHQIRSDMKATFIYWEGKEAGAAVANEVVVVRSFFTSAAACAASAAAIATSSTSDRTSTSRPLPQASTAGL